MQDTLKDQKKKNNDILCTSCDKCDMMHQIFESKMFIVMRDFSQLAKAINEEQTNMNTSMNNTINTVNLLIDQLEENKAALLRSESEIKSLKSEIQQLKNNKSINKVQSRFVSFSFQDSNQSSNPTNSSDNDLNSIKNEIAEIKKELKEYKSMQHNINCIKYEVKKLKSNSNVNQDLTNTIIKSAEVRNQSLSDIDKSKNQNDSLKISNEIKYTDSKNPASKDTSNSQHYNLNLFRDEVKDIKKNTVSPEEIKKIKKQIKKLYERVDTLENKRTTKIKNNNGSEEESTSIIENKEENNDDIINSIQVLNTRVSTLESESQKIIETLTKPKVQQIFVDLPKSRACNLLFRTQNQQNENPKE